MDECTAALDKLIGIVTSDPVLHRPNYDLPFTLEVDASQYAMGAILYQPNDKGRLCPVGYHSHTLNPAERGYDVHDWELLAVMRGLRQWQHLLLSSPFTTTVTIDRRRPGRPGWPNHPDRPVLTKIRSTARIATRQRQYDERTFSACLAEVLQ
jgi:RNase H-like domain found in reverse transcriptase